MPLHAEALTLLRQNLQGRHGLPRTALMGYPEPYTRDLLIGCLGILCSGAEDLIDSVRRVLVALAANQTATGLMPGLVDDPRDLGSSDTTPLFLIALALYREYVGEPELLSEAASRALVWLRYQSPDNSGMIAQLPTSDWRDEQWVLGFGLYVNTLVYLALRLWQQHTEADTLRRLINAPIVTITTKDAHVHEGLTMPHAPYYALWSYKVLYSDRFDLLGNSLAILTGIAPPAKANALIEWIEQQTVTLMERGDLAIALPPCLFPYIQPHDVDWYPRYALFNQPGDYHNGGLWPFCLGFYIAALVAAGWHELARQKLNLLTALLQHGRGTITPAFNEWYKAQDATPHGVDGQSWSATMWLYASAAVKAGTPPLLDAIRQW